MTLKYSGNSHFSIQWGFSMVVCDLCGVNRNNETKALCYALAYTHLHQCEISQYFSDFSAHTIAIPAGISQNGSQLPKRAISTDGCFFMQNPLPQVSSIKNTILRSQNSHQFFQTGVFCNIYSAFSLFFTLGSHAQWKRVERWRAIAATQRGNPRCVAAIARHWSGDSDSAKKSGQKADYIQCRARLASFGAGKIAKIGGKLWQLHSIMYLTDIYVIGHQILFMEPFMRLLVCACGCHWRLRLNTCAKVDGAQHPHRANNQSVCLTVMMLLSLGVLTACRPSRLSQSWIYGEQHICESNSFL